MSAREQFQAQGKLVPCPNPVRSFRLGRLIWRFQWAKNKWCVLDEVGLLHSYWLHLGSIETVDGVKGWKLVVWKFSLLFGRLINVATPEAKP